MGGGIRAPVRLDAGTAYRATLIAFAVSLSGPLGGCDQLGLGAGSGKAKAAKETDEDDGDKKKKKKKKKGDVDEDEGKDEKGKGGESPKAEKIPTTATATPIGPFLRARPEERSGVDACAYLGGLGMACLDALIAETDGAKRAYMRRLSDAEAALSIDAKRRGETGGVAHAEASIYCASAGPCKRPGPDGSQMDDGFACLTKAEIAAGEGDQVLAAAAHARACTCDAPRAIIPVMGGTRACDAPDKPVERGKDLTLGEAKDVRACGQCDAADGPAACQRELDRLDEKDRPVAAYLRATHIPRCQQP